VAILSGAASSSVRAKVERFAKVGITGRSFCRRQNGQCDMDEARWPGALSLSDPKSIAMRLGP